MPLTINLLHEEQFLLKQRKRDPLKLGLYALAGVAALFVMYYGWRLLSSTTIDSQLKARQADWAKQEPAARAAEASEKELTAQVAAADVVSKRIDNRFYWASLLGTLLKSVPGNVQIVSFNGNNEQKNDKVSFTLEGIVAGDVPRLAADKFRTVLTDSLKTRYQGVETSFRGLDDTATPVNLNGKTSSTARFTIEVKLNKSTAAPAATPAPERRRKS